MPGVVCCVFADDIPGENVTGAIEHDETVLAHEKVRAFCLSRPHWATPPSPRPS